MKRIHLFRAGTHRSNSGAVRSFTEDELAASAAAYDPAKHEAPIVVGHPRTDAPAFGWIRGLEYADDLQAVPDQVDPAFSEMVQAGRFKKVSASFYPPDHDRNPVPGVWYLRHVGFLGAQPPAVKGLKPVEFADDAEGVVEIEFGEESIDEGLLARVAARVAQMLGLPRGESASFAEPDYAGPNKTFPIGDAHAVKSAWDLAGKAADPDGVRRRVIEIAKAHGWTEALPAAARDWAKSHSISFTEQEVTDVTKEELEKREAELAAREKQLEDQEASFSERESQISARERESAAAEAAEFVEGLVKAGKVLPREQNGITALLTSLQGAEAVEFSEDEKTVEQAPAEVLRGLLEALPERVDFSERGKNTAGEKPRAPFRVPQGYQVSEEGLELHNEIVAYAEANNVDYETATQRVSQMH